MRNDLRPPWLEAGGEKVSKRCSLKSEQSTHPGHDSFSAFFRRPDALRGLCFAHHADLTVWQRDGDGRAEDVHDGLLLRR